MANKREFKKYVDAVGASIVEEMMIAYYNVKGADKKTIGESVGMILDAIEESKNNSNIYFDRGPKAFSDHKEYVVAKKNFFKALFKKIENDYNTAVENAVKKFNEALPEEYKKAQKKVANA